MVGIHSSSCLSASPLPAVSKGGKGEGGWRERMCIKSPAVVSGCRCGAGECVACVIIMVLVAPPAGELTLTSARSSPPLMPSA